MKKYKAKVIHNVEIVLDDDSTLNTKGWLEIIASNLAYHKAGEHGRYISQEIAIEDMQATEQKAIDNADVQAAEQKAIDNADVQAAKNVYYDAGYLDAKENTIAKAKRLVSVMLDKIEQFGINGDKEMWIENFIKVMEQ